MKKFAILFALILCVALADCNQPAPPQGGEPSEPQETPEVDVIITEPEEPTPPTDEQTAKLYIGTKSERYGACDGVTTLRSYDSCANSGLQYPPSPGARGKYGEFDSS